MSNLDRIKRVTDLFIEGRELIFGDDGSGEPVVVWINKLNAFEEEEARRDGLAARAERLLELNLPGNRERAALEMSAKGLEHEQLVDSLVSMYFDQDYMGAMDDVDSNPEWRDRLLFLQRMNQLHDDAGINDDDERRKRFRDVNGQYFDAIRESAGKRQEDRKKDFLAQTNEELIAKHLEVTLDRVGTLAHLNERRVTEFFYALRDCQGVQTDGVWTHASCLHPQLLESRQQVRGLPDAMLSAMGDALAGLTVDRRTAGNSDAPTNSSESLEPASPPEESTPSSPAVTPPVAVAT